LIVDPDGKGLESHWQKTSQALLVGVILHALYKAQNEGTPATLPAVDAMLADPNRAIAELWMEMVTYQHMNGEPHPVVAAAARDMMDRPEEEAGSVLSTAKSYLALYRDPIVARNVSKSEFKIKDLMHHPSPISLYIVTKPTDKTRLRPLARVMVNMILRLLADRLEFENGRAVAHYRHRLLMMLDEFPALGRLQIFQESLAYLASYGIKCYLICQDIARNRLWPGRKHHIQLPCAERLSAQSDRNGRAPLQAHRTNHRRKGAHHHERRAHERASRPRFPIDPGSTAPFAHAR
jgi:type IV secretion system protein VirD4